MFSRVIFLSKVFLTICLKNNFSFCRVILANDQLDYIGNVDCQSFSRRYFANFRPQIAYVIVVSIFLVYITSEGLLVGATTPSQIIALLCNKTRVYSQLKIKKIAKCATPAPPGPRPLHYITYYYI